MYNVITKLFCSLTNVIKTKYQIPGACIFERIHTPSILRFFLFKNKRKVWLLLNFVKFTGKINRIIPGDITSRLPPNVRKKKSGNEFSKKDIKFWAGAGVGRGFRGGVLREFNREWDDQNTFA